MSQEFLSGLVIGSLIGLIAGVIAAVSLFLLVYIVTEAPEPDPRDMAHRP